MIALTGGSKRTEDIMVDDTLNGTTSMTRGTFVRMATLTTAGVAATGAAAGSAGAKAALADEASTGTAEGVDFGLVAPQAVDETVTCDVVVVGAGISGLAATVQAAQLGLNVLCLEKGVMAGGNGSGTEGVFAVGSAMQQELGIDITPAEIISTELEESQWRTDGSLWLDMCEKSAENIEWLQENGVLFSGVVDNYHTGLFETMHWFEEGHATMGGSCYVEPMVAAAEAAGATIRYNTQAYLLIKDDAGAVVGLYAQDAETGAQIQVDAGAVILASGGIGGNAELLARQGWQQYNIDNKIVMCVPTVDGDGYKMALTAGAHDFLPYSCDQAFIGIKALGTDATAPYSSTLNGGNGIAGSGATLWLNQDGNRFNNEAINHVNMAAPEPACCRLNRESYVLFDQATVDAVITDPADRELFEAAVADEANADSLVRSDSIEGLAENFGLDPEQVMAQVERYNGYCASGADLDFGKDPQFMVAIQNPPYYMGRIVPLFVVVIGGITTNIRSEVLDDSLNAIPGLYAVGLDGAMLHRNVYTQNMPGSNMGNNVNTGRNAARSAAEYLDK